MVAVTYSLILLSAFSVLMVFPYAAKPDEA
jgi:hypothetical protein